MRRAPRPRRRGRPSGYALERVLSSALARLRGDTATLALEAAIYDEFGTTEAVPSILAEGALLWLEVGEPARASVGPDQARAALLGAA